MIRIITEHDGTREYPEETHETSITDGLLEVYARESGAIALTVADGHWRSVERTGTPEVSWREKDARVDRMHEIVLLALARVEAEKDPARPPFFTPDELDALYQAAHGTEE